MYPYISSHTVLINTPCFVIFRGLYVLTFKQPSIGSQIYAVPVLLLQTQISASYTGYIFEILPKSCACWLLLLKYQATQIASNWFLLIVLGKIGAEIVGSFDQ